MFGRTKEAQAPAVVHLEKVGGKNRPTPTRSSAQAANRRPLVATDRKGATAASRTLTRDERRRAQEGRLAGEDRYLPARDAGPLKAYLRDLVDTRRNAGDYFMPAIIVIVVVQFALQAIIGVTVLTTAMTGVLWLLVLAVLIDSMLLRAKVRRAVRGRFGEGQLSGVVAYAVMRAVQMRRLRIPRPAVKQGDLPR